MTLLSEAVASFQLSCLADGVTDKTIGWYVWLLNDSPHASIPWLTGRGTGSVQSIRTNELRQYIVWLRGQANTRTGARQSDDTIAGYIRALHRFWAWCAAEYHIENPMDRIAWPKQTEQRPKALDLNDLNAMFVAAGEGALGDRNRAIMAFLLDTGCRAAGLCGLTIDRMDPENQRALVIEKGDRQRMVVWTRRTAEYLQAWEKWRAPVEPYFYNLQRNHPAPLTPNGLRIILRKLGDAAGVQGRVNPHSFRHAFAREYILNGGDLATLSRLMGHRQVSTTVGFYAIFTERELAQKHERYSPMRGLDVEDV